MNKDVNSAFLQKYTAELWLVLMTILWGGTFVIIKDSLNYSSPMMFIGIRFSVAFLCLVPFLYLKRRLITKDAITSGALLGLLMFFSFSTQTSGLKYTSATKSAFLTGSCVVIVPFVQTFIEKRIPTKGSIIGIIFVFTGIVFLSSGGSSIINIFIELGNNFNFGDFLTIISALLFAFHIVYLDIVSSKHNYLVIAASQIFICAIAGFIFSYFFNLLHIENTALIFNSNLLAGIIYTAIFATVITTTVQTKFQKEVTPSKAGIIYSFEPIFAALFAYFLLNEKMTNFGIIGCALIFLGLIISEIFDSLVANGYNKKKS